MKVLTVLGTRPQFIKSYLVSRAFREFGVEEIILDTGQHYDALMAGNFIDELSMNRPKYTLELQSALPAQQIAKMINGVDEVCRDEKPNFLLVYGDTNSTLAASIAGNKLGVKMGHVEAGVRSFSRTMPEEINRIVADQVCDLLFLPAHSALENLENEGVCHEHRYFVGDIHYDVFLDVSKKIDRPKVRSGIFATFHRAENTDNFETLRGIVGFLEALAADFDVTCALHPRSKKAMKNAGLSFEKVNVLDPLSYSQTLKSLFSAEAVVTDSGGLQKEASYAGAPCFLLRDRSEWKELVSLGLAKTNQKFDAESLLLSFGDFYRNKDSLDLCFKDLPYGKGNAHRLIADKIKSFLS